VDRSLVVPLVYATMALAWGGTWVAGKVVVAQVPPLEMSAVRFAIAAVVLLAIVRVTRTPLGTAFSRYVLLAAFFGIFAYNAMVFIGLTIAPASDGALITPTAIPVLTAVAATFIGEPLTRRKVLGLILASAGSALVIAGGQATVTAGLSIERLVGDLLFLGGALCWAAYSVFGSVAMRAQSPIAFTALTVTIGAAMLFPLGFLERGYADVPAWQGSAWVLVLLLALASTVLAFALYLWAVRRFGAGLGSLVGYLVPIAGVSLSFLLLGERPHPLQLVGGAVILAGVRVATMRRRDAPLEAAA
jgi:drug/metabolite transporter (DMT)-like permease